MRYVATKLLHHQKVLPDLGTDILCSFFLNYKKCEIFARKVVMMSNTQNYFELGDISRSY